MTVFNAIVNRIRAMLIDQKWTWHDSDLPPTASTIGSSLGSLVESSVKWARESPVSDDGTHVSMPMSGGMWVNTTVFDEHVVSDIYVCVGRVIDGEWHDGTADWPVD